MRIAVWTLIIALMTAGLSYAADTGNAKQQPDLQKFSHAIHPSANFYGMYSKRLNEMCAAALSSDITGEQKTKVTELRDKYVDSMSKDERELRRTNLDIRKMLQDPSFDLTAVKKEMGKAEALDKKVSENYVDAIASLRDAIGGEHYAAVSKSVSRSRSDLVQMRTNKQPNNRPQGAMKNAPARTLTPGAQESKN